MLGFTKFKINRLVNRRELYSNFSYNKWNQLDTGSKWKCLQQLENHFAAEQGRPAVKVLPISSKEVRGDYGGYDPDKNVIYINRDLVEYGTLVGPVDINHPTQLDANMQLFDTIAHEGYHAYQGYAIKHPGLRSYLNSITPHIMVDILNQHSDLKAMQSYIYDEKSGQTLGVMAELQQMMREIFIGNFQKKGGLSMRKLVRRKGGRVIFVEYDLGIGGMLMPIYRLLIDLAIKEALCRTSNEGNVYFFIDEFRLVPHLEHIDDGVNFGRSLGAKFFVGIQNIDQVMAAYGEYTGRSILSGFGTTFAFRVNDVGSREYIKNLFGRNIKQQSYMSKVQNRGIAEQLREGYVVEDDDINNLPVGEAIVSAPSGEPFRFKFNLYQ